MGPAVAEDLLIGEPTGRFVQDRNRALIALPLGRSLVYSCTERLDGKINVHSTVLSVEYILNIKGEKNGPTAGL